MIEGVLTFVKYPEMEVLKVTSTNCSNLYKKEYLSFDTLPPKEFIVEFRVAKTYSDNGVLLCETHLLHNVFNINALEEIEKL